MPAEAKFVSLQEAAAAGDRDHLQQSMQLSSLNPLAMRNAELPGQNLERMRRLGAVNGNGVGGGGEHSDVECDDDFYDDQGRTDGAHTYNRLRFLQKLYANHDGQEVE